MKTIVAAGHACIDITPVFHSGKENAALSELLVPGRLLSMEGTDVHPGGSVSNTGLALKLLGNDVRLLGKTGDDALGAVLRNMYAEYGAYALKPGMQGFRNRGRIMLPDCAGGIFRGKGMEYER